jgi:transposase-like protein
MAVMIGDKPFWLWRAVDSEGEVIDLLVQRRATRPLPLS